MNYYFAVHEEYSTSLPGDVCLLMEICYTKRAQDVSSDPGPHLILQATPPPPECTGEKVSRQERRRKERFKKGKPTTGIKMVSFKDLPAQDLARLAGLFIAHLF